MQMQLKIFQVQISYPMMRNTNGFSLEQKPCTQHTTDQSLLCTPDNKLQLDTAFGRTRKLIGI